MEQASYQLRILIGLAIALAYSYAAFEYKWKVEVFDDPFIGCIEIPAHEIPPPPVILDEEHIPITHQNSPYVPQFEQLSHEELKEGLKEIIKEAPECELEVISEDIECQPCDLPTGVFISLKDASPKGGMKNFYSFIKKELQYPEALKEAGIEGKVFVQFTVEKTGKLSDIKVIRGIHPLLDQEAVRVMNLAEDWIPAKQCCCSVKQRITFPIN